MTVNGLTAEAARKLAAQKAAQAARPSSDLTGQQIAAAKELEARIKEIRADETLSDIGVNHVSGDHGGGA